MAFNTTLVVPRVLPIDTETGVVSFGAASYEGNEGTTISFVINRSGNPTQQLQVDWAITGVPSVTPSTGRVQFYAGDLIKIVDVIAGLVTADERGLLAVTVTALSDTGNPPTEPESALFSVLDVASDLPPVITHTPSPTFVQGIASTYDMTQHVSDDGVSPVVYTINGALAIGLSFNSASGILDYDGIGPIGSSSHTLTASDDVGSDTSQLFSADIVESTVVDFPRLAAYAIGGQVYTPTNSAGITLAERIGTLAKNHLIIYGGWRGWAYSGEDMQSICGTIKAQSTLQQQWILKYDDPAVYTHGEGTYTHLHPQYKMAAENGPGGTDWCLRRPGNGGRVAIEGFERAPLINNSVYATVDTNGYSPAYWKGLFITADNGDSAEDWARNIDGYSYSIGFGIKPDYGWDGVWFDDCTWFGFYPGNGGTYTVAGYPDIDQDGIENRRYTDDVYIAMMAKMVADGSDAVKSRFPDFLTGGNHGANCNPQFGWDYHGRSPDNGKTFPQATRGYHDVIFLEKLAGESWSVETYSSWHHMMRTYKNGIFFSTRADSKAVFHVSAGGSVPVGYTTYEWHRYGLCSALQDNGYYAATDENGYASHGSMSLSSILVSP
jgi:hypothetical protein